MRMLNIISTAMTIAEFALATNPVTIVISGVMIVLDLILNIFSTVMNIMAIGKLKSTRNELIEYFKAGG